MEDDDDDRKVIVISQTEEFRDEWFSFFKRWYKTSYCWCVVGFFHNQSLTVEDLRLSPTALSSLFLLSSFRFHLSVGLSTRKQLYCCCCFAVDVRTRQASRVWRTSEDHQRPGSGSPSRHLIIGKSVSCSSGLWPLSGRHLFRLCMKKHSSEHRVQNNIFFMGLLVYLKLQRFFLTRT